MDNLHYFDNCFQRLYNACADAEASRYKHFDFGAVDSAVQAYIQKNIARLKEHFILYDRRPQKTKEKIR